MSGKNRFLRTIHAGPGPTLPVLAVLPLALLPLSLLAARPASAQPRHMAPDHDVTVTYLVTDSSGDNPAAKLRLSYRVDGPLTRVDSYVFKDAHQPFNTVFYDGAQHQRIIVVYQLQAYFQEPQPDPGIPELSLTDAMALTELGADSVDGQACTDWRQTAGPIPGTVVCLRDDGIILRVASPTRVMEVSLIDPTPMPPDRFTLPVDLHPMLVPPAPAKAAAPPAQ
jgi:hypothetical protein